MHSLTEGDLIIGAGQRSAIATLVERKFRTTVLVPVARDHSAQTVADALIAAFGKLPIQLRRTLTWDQGNEMFQHHRIEQATGLTIYFADPHSPWQRGSNENINGLLRQYFPKGTDLNAWTADNSTTSPPSSMIVPVVASPTRHRTKPCNDGHVSRHDDDSQRSLETARCIR